MAWIQISIRTDKISIEVTENCLFAQGAQTVTLCDGADQPILEPEPGQTPVWDQAVVTGLFSANIDIAATEITIRQCLQNATCFEIKHEQLEDRNWTRAWMDNYQPMQFGKRLWVCPWHIEPPDKQAVNLRLDPGLAFGTGTHPTTTLCLRWLDTNINSQQTLLDFGCGSGILAIAARLLGVANVDGVDIDPQAIQASQSNAHNNEVGAGIQLFLTEAYNQHHATTQYDIVMANILSGPLTQLAPQLAGHCRQHGDIVLSGILREQAETIWRVYHDYFIMDTPTLEKDWVLLHGIRR